MIEVTGSPEVTSGEREVRVVVRAETRRRRHVVLLLRLGDRATSYIATERLRGTLDVVVSHCRKLVLVHTCSQDVHCTPALINVLLFLHLAY